MRREESGPELPKDIVQLAVGRVTAIPSGVFELIQEANTRTARYTSSGDDPSLVDELLKDVTANKGWVLFRIDTDEDSGEEIRTIIDLPTAGELIESGTLQDPTVFELVSNDSKIVFFPQSLAPEDTVTGDVVSLWAHPEVVVEHSVGKLAVAAVQNLSTGRANIFPVVG